MIPLQRLTSMCRRAQAIIPDCVVAYWLSIRRRRMPRRVHRARGVRGEACNAP